MFDQVVDFLVDDLEKLTAAFPQEERRAQRGHFNIIHHETGFKADVYPCGKDRLSRLALERARRIEVEGSSVAFAPPEYVILRKLEYFREGGSEKHLRDIEGILESSLDLLDFDEIERWLDALGVRKEWETLRAERRP